MRGWNCTNILRAGSRTHVKPVIFTHTRRCIGPRTAVLRGAGVDVKDRPITDHDIPTTSQPDQLAHLVRHPPWLIVECQELWVPPMLLEGTHSASNCAQVHAPGQVLWQCWDGDVAVPHKPGTQTVDEPNG